jgi:hypothetical protein
MVGRAQDALAELYLLSGDPAAAVARGRVAQAVFAPLLAADPENRLVQEIATATAAQLAEALLLDGKPKEAAQVNAAALASAADLVASDPARVTWRTNSLMKTRTLEVAIAAAGGQEAAVRQGLARFEADFGAFRAADIAAQQGSNWVTFAALAAAERLRAGDWAGASLRARQAAEAAGTTPAPRAAALLSALSSRTEGATAAPTATTTSYPADRLLGFGART